MKLIPLTKGLFAQVDDADFEYLSQYSWLPHGPPAGRSYAVAFIEGKRTFMHRLLLNPPPDKIIDHVDLDGLNNQRANIRICTRAENSLNCPKPNKQKGLRATCKYKGVSRTSGVSAGSFSASITKAGKRLHLGCFRSEEAAAVAYNRAALQLHGDFARLNPVVDTGGLLERSPQGNRLRNFPKQN